MPISHLPPPDLSLVAQGGATLWLLESLGQSADGATLLVRATFTDDADATLTLRYAVWTYDVIAGLYAACLNQLVPNDGTAASDFDVTSASLAGAGATIVAEATPRAGSGEARLVVIEQGSVVRGDLLGDLLGDNAGARVQKQALSTDGRWLVIQTDSALLAPADAPDTNDSSDIYLVDLVTSRVERVSFLAGAEVYAPVALGNVHVEGGAVQVGFTTTAAFVTSDRNGSAATQVAQTDAYLWSRPFDGGGLTGTAAFTLVSRTGSGNAAGHVAEGSVAATSAGVFFASSAADLVVGDENLAEDVFLNRAGQVERIGLIPASEMASGASLVGASDDGGRVALLTRSEEVVGPSAVQQVVVYGTGSGSWEIASSGAAGPANDWVTSATLAPNGGSVALSTAADNLTGAPTATAGDLYLAEVDLHEATGIVGLSGIARAGAVLTLATGAVSDRDGALSFRYQWQASSDRSTWTEISDAQSATYLLPDAQAGHFVRGMVTTTDPHGGTTVMASEASQAVQLRELPPAPVQVSGMAYHWKSHTLLEGVDVEVQATAAGAPLATGTTGHDGTFGFSLPASASYAMTATRSATDAGSAITSADALAALRLAVGINPNVDPDGPGPLQAPKVSPYQIIAADVNGDGKVTSADALAILRMAVKIASAPAQQWDFVSESLDLWNEATGSSSLTRTSAAYDHALNAQLLQDTTANLVGVLRGDVNGSWTPPAGSVDLDVTRPDYFQLLGAQLGVPTDVWGV